MEACDESSVYAEEFAIVFLKGNSEACVRDGVDCFASDSSHVTAEGFVAVSLSDSATGEFHNDSQVSMAGGRAELFDNSRVSANGGNVFL